MAIGAIEAELFVVHIFVAPVAIIGAQAEAVLKNSGRRSVHRMAAGTIQGLVFAFQGKMGLAVVKSFQTCQRIERLFDMALFAICTQIGIMGVIVAVVAVGECDAGEYLKVLAVARFLFVAFGAIDCAVFPGKGKIGFGVVKIGSRENAVVVWHLAQSLDKVFW